jgi:hypothetical protein
MTKIQTIRKPNLQAQEQQPRNIKRADIAPVGGFALVVDGHFKTQFESEAAAQKAARQLLMNYPMLRVEIYDGREGPNGDQTMKTVAALPSRKLSCEIIFLCYKLGPQKRELKWQRRKK